MRQNWLAGVALVGTVIAGALATVETARAETTEPLKIAVLNDMNGVFANDQGPGSLIAAQLAIDDYGKLVNRKIELLSGDHQNKPDIGSALTRQWLDSGVQLILDVPNSAIAFDVMTQVQAKNKVFIGSGAGSAEITGPRCSPNTAQWTYDTWSLGHSLGQAVVAEGGKSWFAITSDYAFGYDLEAQTFDAVKAAGGTIKGSVRAPLGTSDFSSYLLQAQSSGAQVLLFAIPGQDAVNSLKQASEFGIGKSMKLANPTVNGGYVHSMGLADSQGLLGVSAFYWDLNDGTRAFSKRFMERYARHWPPNDMQAGVYSAVKHYLEAVAAGADPDDGRATMAEMKKLPVDDVIFGKGSLRADGREIHPVYLFQVKSPAESKSEWDVFKVVSSVPADRAYRPMDQGGCKMVEGLK
jgi:branched-chain amino acid transport system substrate-binding protein